MKNTNKSNHLLHKLLKNEIEEAFGKKVNSAGDCLLLSDEVFEKISVKVSSNTLRRFFGLVKSPFHSSIATLNILSRYCGFHSYNELISLKKNIAQPNDDDPYANSILIYLVSLFKYSPVKDDPDKTFATIVKITVDFLLRHPELIDKFQRAISKTKNGQDFYYEQFIHIDGLNSFYGEGLRYYLTGKNTPQAQVFGHSLLCFRDWMSGNKNGVREHYTEVSKQRLLKPNNPFLCGLVFTAQLLNANVEELSIDKILIKVHQAHALFRQKRLAHKFSHYFEFIISPVLVFTGHPQEALYYINYALNDYPHHPSELDSSLYESMKLIKTLILVKLGKKALAEKLYLQIQPSRFHLLTKKLSTILYIFLSHFFNKCDEKSNQQFHELISATGFKRLNSILN